MADANGDKQIPASYQAGLGNSCAIGQIIGLVANGYLAERFGYRRVMIGCLIVLIGLFFMFFFAKSLDMLIAAELLAGIPWGSELSILVTR